MKLLYNIFTININIMRMGHMRYKYSSKKFNNKSHFLLKSQQTTDTNSYKTIVSLPQIRRPKTQLAKIQPQKRYPLMNDDFCVRKCMYKQSFVMGKNRVIQCEVSFTAKFCYFVLHDVKFDSHYKLRLILQTGKKIMQHFENNKYYLLRDHISRDQDKRFYLTIPFSPFQRKFYFAPMVPSSIAEQNCQDEDTFLKETIKNLDRTQFLFQNMKEKRHKTLQTE